MYPVVVVAIAAVALRVSEAVVARSQPICTTRLKHATEDATDMSILVLNCIFTVRSGAVASRRFEYIVGLSDVVHGSRETSEVGV